LDHFYGYARPVGSYGVKNYVAVVPSVICANKVAERIAEGVNGARARLMKDNIDINAGKLITFDNVSIKDVGHEIFAELFSVSSGKLTKAEILGNNELAIWRIGLSL